MAQTLESTDVAGVHGMVVVNADGTAVGAPVGVATASNQTNGAQKTQIVDAGGEVATVTGGKLDVNASASLTGEAIPATGATTAVSVQIVNGSGNQVVPQTDALTDTQLRATAVPVSGTFWQATQPVSGNLGSDLRVGGAAVSTTNPVSIQPPASGHLHVDGDGIAGTPATGVVTVQGITSMTPLKVDGSGVTQPVSGTFWQATQPVSGTVSITANSAVNVAQINGVATTMGNGVSGTGVQRVTLASDSTGNIATIGTSVTPGTGATNLGKAEDVAHASGDTGVAVWAVRDDTLGATSGTEGDYEALHTNADGALWVSQAPSATGGLSVFAATSQDGGTALTSTAQAIKASAGVLYGWYIYNPNSSAAYVVLYNTAAASVTVGTTNPLFVLCIPATAGANVMSPMGIGFSNAGWSVAATTTGGGNTAPTTALEAVFFYK